MSGKHLFKRVVIDLGVIAAVLALVVSVLWLWSLPGRWRAQKEAKAMLASWDAQADELRSLGEVNLDPANLTYGDMLRQLHQPALREAGRDDTTKLGWACASKICAVIASFPGRS